MRTPASIRHYISRRLRRLRWAWLPALVIAVGVAGAVSSSVLALGLMANPAGRHGMRVYNVQVDNHGPDSRYSKPGEPPSMVSYVDAMALLESEAASHQVLMYPTEVAVSSHAHPEPRGTQVRMTTADFFAMFDVPFEYGGGWGRDPADDRVAVISQRLNDALFAGRNSVGDTMHIGEDSVTVVGVLRPWSPLPRYYDLPNGQYLSAEDVFMPLNYGVNRHLRTTGSWNCGRPPADTAEYDPNAQCNWLNLWVELPDVSAKRAYQQLIEEHIRSEQIRGRFSFGMHYQLLNVPQWLRNQDVLHEDVRVQMLVSYAFLAVCVLNVAALLFNHFTAQGTVSFIHRALGASRWQVVHRHLRDAAWVGAIGGVAGIAFTVVGLSAVRALDPELAGFARFDVTAAVLAVAMAVGGTVLAAVVPAWVLARHALAKDPGVVS